MPSAPIIGITATSEMIRDALRVRVNASYIRAVEEAGGVPVVLPPLDSLAGASHMIDRMDALLVTGGEDIDPARFNEPRHPALGPVHDARDATEIQLVTMAHERAMPTLAICRGIQLLNVALGGSLIQDIPSQRPQALPHDPGGARDARSHDVEVAPASRLALILGTTQLAVNSFHHQAVDRIAEGLRLTAWSSDDVVEGVEWDGTDWWAVGVQWHPEELVATNEPWDRELFRAFVEEARAVSSEL
ncbi:MAG TPA: gamma-glutamyl-gamma-aminobutyrate hydrolase family protein [Gemmatimonadaceae bacterium]|nr:gamma-glutamyl-gamma-aminobutyrate hydrolase family protein [Gemmatimonadaceae bacterium]